MCDYPLSISYITQKGAIIPMETNRSARLHEQAVEELEQMSLLYPAAPQARLLAADEQSGSGTGSAGSGSGSGDSGGSGTGSDWSGGDGTGGSGSGSAVTRDAETGVASGDDQSA